MCRHAAVVSVSSCDRKKETHINDITDTIKHAIPDIRRNAVLNNSEQNLAAPLPTVK